MSQAEELLNSLTEDIAYHEHTVVDTDSHFVINPDTREITNPTASHYIMHGDHNSEVYTFELPRYIDGHDMMLCNRVKVHFINISSDEWANHADARDLPALELKEGDASVVTCAWCIDRVATQYVGKLSFGLEFQCVTDTGEIVYEWNTDVYSNVEIKDSLDHGEQVAANYSDILEQWRAQLFGAGDSVLTDIANAGDEQKEAIALKGEETLATIPEDYTTVANMAEEALRKKANAIVLDAEGEIISVDDSSDAYLLGLNLYGKSTQFTTTGKNLLPTKNGAYGLRNGLTFTDLGHGVVSIAGTASANTTYVYVPFEPGLRETIPAGTYTLSGSPGATVFLSLYVYADQETTESFLYKASLCNGETWTFTLDSDAYYGAYLYIGSGKSANEIVSAQLELGSEATAYEPYTGGIPAPNPDYPQEIVSIDNPTVTIVGKNLIDQLTEHSFVGADNGITLTLNPDNTVHLDGTSTGRVVVYLVRSEKRVFLEPGTYTLSVGTNLPEGAEVVFEKYVDGVWNSVIDRIRPGESSVTVTVTERTNVAAYLAINTGSTVTDFTIYPQLELSSEATEYEPYVEPQTLTLNRTLPGIPVTSGGNYTDSDGQQWICDEIDLERGVYIQRVNTNTVEFFEVAYGDTFRYNAIIDPAASSEFDGMVLCDVLPFHKSASVDVRGVRVATTSPSKLVAWCGDRELTTGTVVYILATPIETALTEEEIAYYKRLKTNYHNTTVFNDQGVYMSIRYAADTLIYLRDHQPPPTDEQVQNAVDNYLDENGVQIPSDEHINTLIYAALEEVANGTY